MDEMKCGRMVNYLDECRRFYVRRSKSESQRRLKNILHAAVNTPSQRLNLGFRFYPKEIFEENIIRNIFTRTDDEGRKNMAEACKQCAKWFLLEGPKSLFMYEKTLTKEDTGVWVTMKEGNKIIQTYCKCREARTPEETAAIHRLERLREAGLVGEDQADETEAVVAEKISESQIIYISSDDEEALEPSASEIVPLSSSGDNSST